MNSVRASQTYYPQQLRNAFIPRNLIDANVPLFVGMPLTCRVHEISASGAFQLTSKAADVLQEEVCTGTRELDVYPKPHHYEIRWTLHHPSLFPA